MVGILATNTFNLMAEGVLIESLTLLFGQQYPNVVPFLFVYINTVNPR
jgi:hypothetical protein